MKPSPTRAHVKLRRTASASSYDKAKKRLQSASEYLRMGARVVGPLFKRVANEVTDGVLVVIQKSRCHNSRLIDVDILDGKLGE